MPRLELRICGLTLNDHPTNECYQEVELITDCVELRRRMAIRWIVQSRIKIFFKPEVECCVCRLRQCGSISERYAEVDNPHAVRLVLEVVEVDQVPKIVSERRSRGYRLPRQDLSFRLKV